MVNKAFKIVTFFVPLVLLVGCWDDIEIEDRGFLSGVAVDLAGEQEEKLYFELTHQIVVPSGLGSTTQPGGGRAFRNLSQTGESIFKINRDISRQANRKINVEHLNIALFSTDIIEKEGVFPKILDIFVRQQSMRRGLKLAVAEGKAKELFYVQTEHVKIPAQYLSELLENREVPITVEPTRVGDIQEALLQNRSFALPQLTLFSDNSVNYSGIAAIRGKTGQWVGTIYEEEAKGRNFIFGRNLQGNLTTTMDGELLTVNITKGGRKVTLKNKDKHNLKFDVDIEVEASIAEYYGTIDVMTKETNDKFSKALEDEIKEQSELAIAKLKDELKVDIFDFDDYLTMYHYELWKEVEDDWDYGENYFSKSDININVNAIILDPGSSFKVKQDGGEQ
ncbi:Ger(x)C family spore germination protein [Ornithinibacillus halophilus]|uniref:Spore germination protein n=1 Tax=Ornithinibacillus halophilus TaxID=930117 RepID=A0A1M5NHK8_9BACI|nr:Ger(x)C family spore germination protein [Ornithinibacillus halophilus]SHG88972.1 spore germination protein [Ornithinibacillus halophilus]